VAAWRGGEAMGCHLDRRQQGAMVTSESDCGRDALPAGLRATALALMQTKQLLLLELKKQNPHTS
jgi:hypothetical protein